MHEQQQQRPSSQGSSSGSESRDQSQKSSKKSVGESKDQICSESEKTSKKEKVDENDQSKPKVFPQETETQSSSGKWPCDYCTYLNWQSATKCTLCRAPKPLQRTRIEDLGRNLRHDDDSDGNCGRGSSAGDEDVRRRATDEKWECHICTYLNFPRSKRCTQCRGEKPGEHLGGSDSHPISGGFRESRPGEVTNFLKVNLPSLAKTDLEEKRERHFSPPAGSSKDIKSGGSSSGAQSPKSIVLTNKSVSLDHRMVAKKLQKWTCPGCTYENWSKAVKCVLCYTPKPGCLPSRSLVQQTSSPGGPGRDGGTLQQGGIAGSQSPPGIRDKKRSHQGGGREGVGETDRGRKSPKSSSSGSSTENLAAAAAPVASYLEKQETKLERQLRRLRQHQARNLDFLWLTAVQSVVKSAYDCDPAEAYLAAGGDPTRGLTVAEAQMMEETFLGQRFEPGHTLAHLAYKYRREDLIVLLVACKNNADNSPFGNQQSSSAFENSEGPSSSALNKRQAPKRFTKRVPSFVSPDTASDIRRHIATSLRQRKGEIPCFFFTELTTFSLTGDIYDLPPSIQQRLFDELLDQGVQKELEEDEAIINWNLDVTDRLGSRLFALWNRTAGDCLLDSVLQATWGVFDSENSLRQALADSLTDAAHLFYPRWREYETILASTLEFSLDETQFARDWDLILQLASKPGSALEQAHIFVLAHIIRRPIIVYGVRVVKSYRGEVPLDFARFEGVYLPLLWEPSFCWRSPVCLGYTRGHFCALVPMEPSAREHGASARLRDPQLNPYLSPSGNAKVVYLPLMDAEGKVLPVHFLTRNEVNQEQAVVRTFLDICTTDSGLYCCRMKLHKQGVLVQQMLDDWLDFYRRLAVQNAPPAIFGPASVTTTTMKIVPTAVSMPANLRNRSEPPPSTKIDRSSAGLLIGGGSMGSIIGDRGRIVKSRTCESVEEEVEGSEKKEEPVPVESSHKSFGSPQTASPLLSPGNDQSSLSSGSVSANQRLACSPLIGSKNSDSYESEPSANYELDERPDEDRKYRNEDG